MKGSGRRDLDLETDKEKRDLDLGRRKGKDLKRRRRVKMEIVSRESLLKGLPKRRMLRIMERMGTMTRWRMENIRQVRRKRMMKKRMIPRMWR